MADWSRIYGETGEAATPDLPAEDRAKSACIFLNKRRVEGAWKVREDKTLTNETLKVSI